MWKIYKKLKDKIAIALCTCLVLALCFPFEAQALIMDSSNKLDINPLFYATTNSCLKFESESGAFWKTFYQSHVIEPKYTEEGKPYYGYSWQQQGDSATIFREVMQIFMPLGSFSFVKEHAYTVKIKFYTYSLYNDYLGYTMSVNNASLFNPVFTGWEADSYGHAPLSVMSTDGGYLSSMDGWYGTNDNDICTGYITFNFTCPSDGLNMLVFTNFFTTKSHWDVPYTAQSVDFSFALDDVIITDVMTGQSWSFADLPENPGTGGSGGGESESTPPSGGGSGGSTVPEPLTPDVAQGVEDGLNNVAPDTDKYNQSQQDANNQLDDMQGQADDLYDSLDGIDVPDFKPSDWDIFKSAPVVMTWLGEIWDHLGVWQYVILAFLASGIVVTIIGVVSRYRN